MTDIQIQAKVFVKANGAIRAVRKDGVGSMTHNGVSSLDAASGEQAVELTLNLPESFFQERLKINIEVPEIDSDKQKAKTSFIYDGES